MNKKSLAKEVHNARVFLGLSQKEAAQLIGIPLAELQQLESEAIYKAQSFVVEEGRELIDSEIL